MAKIILTRGFTTTVDDSDLEFISKYKLHAHVNKDGSVYAVTQKGINIHRLLLKVNSNQLVDHINGNTLDNRRKNLRIATKAQNGMNRTKQVNNKSGYKGVSFRPDRNKFRATIYQNKKQTHLGYFDSVIDAAKAYNKAARKHFGEFARLNEV